MIKVNGHRTATIADLEHAEAVMGARLTARPSPSRRRQRRPSAGEGLERAGPAVRPLPERRPRLRQLRRPDRPLRHLLPLLQLRQQHGVLVSGSVSVGDNSSLDENSARFAVCPVSVPSEGEARRAFCYRFPVYSSAFDPAVRSIHSKMPSVGPVSEVERPWAFGRLNRRRSNSAG